MFRRWCQSCFFLTSSRKSAAESFANQTLKVTDVQKNYFQVIQKFMLQKEIEYLKLVVLCFWRAVWGILARSRRLFDRETYVELDKNLVFKPYFVKVLKFYDIKLLLHFALFFSGQPKLTGGALKFLYTERQVQ